MGGALFLSPRPFPPARPPPLPGRGENASSLGLVLAHVLAWLADQLVAALGEMLVVVIVFWHEDRAALDLALGLVVLLTAPPRISDGKAGLVMLDAASAFEGAAHLDYVMQVEGGRGGRGRICLGDFFGGVKGTLCPL